MNRQRGFATILIYLGLAAVAMGAAATLYFKVVGDAYEKGQADLVVKIEQDAKARRERDQARIGAAGSNRESDRGKIRTRYRTITETVVHYVQVDPDLYSGMCLPDDGLRAANQALTNGRSGATPGKSDAGVPGPDPAKGRNALGGAPKAAGGS